MQGSAAQTAGHVAAQASLRILGIGLDFDSISERLRLEPSDTHRKGDHGLISRPYPSDMWLVESPLPRTEPLDAHIRWLRRVLSPRYEPLRSFMSGYEVSVYCGITVEGVSCSVRISPETLSIFSDLRIPLDLTYIFTGYAAEGVQEQDADVTDRCGASATVEPVCEVELRVPDGSRKPCEDSEFVLPRASESLRVPIDRRAGPDEHLRWLGGFLEEGAHVIGSWRESGGMLVRCKLCVEDDYGDFNVSAQAIGPLVRTKIPLEFHLLLKR